MGGIVLFALTGTGNAVLRALCRSGHSPALVVSRREPGPYPYYAETDLSVDARSIGVEVLFGAEGESRALVLRPDLVLVATYHRILPPAFRESCRMMLNLHPSLLPKYRGPNPFFWVLRNGESSTGVTLHELVPAIDAGPVLWQRSIPVAADETQGSLRRRLADVAAEGAIQAVGLIGSRQVGGCPQDEAAATYYGKPSESDRTLRASMDLAEALRVARAALPFPGAIVDGHRVDQILKVWSEPPAHGTAPVDGTLLLELEDGAILFRRASSVH